MGCPGPRSFSLSIKLCPFSCCPGPAASLLLAVAGPVSFGVQRLGLEKRQLAGLELLWSRSDLAGRRLRCGWLIPLLAMAEGFSVHAAWHAYGVFVGWVLGFFRLPFTCWGVWGVMSSRVPWGWAVLSLLPLVPWKGQGDGIMLLAGVGTSLLLMAQICCSKQAFSFPSRNLLGFITAFAHCVSKGWVGVGVQFGA